MPTYEYRCNACHRKVTLHYKTYAEYDEAVPVCTHCGSADLTRLISRVAIRRSPLGRLMNSDDVNDNAFDDLDTDDPVMLGRMLREMSAESGEDLGGEFEEVVDRLERGESPEDIESSLPDMPADVPPPSPLGGGLGDLGGLDD